MLQSFGDGVQSRLGVQTASKPFADHPAGPITPLRARSLWYALAMKARNKAKMAERKDKRSEAYDSDREKQNDTEETCIRSGDDDARKECVVGKADELP
jgi:hypothetical protein